MTKLYLTYFFVLLAFLTNAQNLTFEQVDSLTTSIIAQLLQEQDSVLLHEFGCVGCYFISDYGCNCKQYNSLYWRDSSNTRIQKIDCCGAQEPSTLDQNVWSKFELDAKDILNSKFKTSYYVIHHAFDFLSLATPDTTITIRICDFYFNSDQVDSAANMNQPAKIFLDYLTKQSN